LQPLHPGTKPKATANGTTTDDLSSQARKDSSLNLELRRNIYSTDARFKTKSVEPEQAAMAASEAASGESRPRTTYTSDVSGVDLPGVRYQSIKDPSYNISESEYREGRFPNNLTSGDFIRVEESPFKHGTDEPWSDQETLRLLEGLEMYDDDWDKIEEHVGTRSREQCIAAFLQLPIEDQYLGHAQVDAGPLQYAKIPFSRGDNPVMSVVAFLASVVDPKVAAAAAQSTISELKASLRNKAEGGADKAEEKGASMAIDGGAEASEKPATSGAKGELERAATTALSAAAAKAHVLATQDDRELERLVRELVDAQVKKLELKLAHFDELESILEAERREVEQARQQLYDERLEVAKQWSKIREAAQKIASGQAVSPQELAGVTTSAAAASKESAVRPVEGDASSMMAGGTLSGMT
jgi:SWI/SNF related-matrix-associated actin-dependent regulator of chromatin subfamily C